MYLVESSTIDSMVGNHIQFENEDVIEGEKIYINQNQILTVDTVMTNSTGVVITSGEEFIKLKKI